MTRAQHELTIVPIDDITTDTCECGAKYVTRNGDPDPYLYGVWYDHHIDHGQENTND